MTNKCTCIIDFTNRLIKHPIKDKIISELWMRNTWLNKNGLKIIMDLCTLITNEWPELIIFLDTDTNSDNNNQYDSDDDDINF